MKLLLISFFCLFLWWGRGVSTGDQTRGFTCNGQVILYKWGTLPFFIHLRIGDAGVEEPSVIHDAR